MSNNMLYMVQCVGKYLGEVFYIAHDDYGFYWEAERVEASIFHSRKNAKIALKHGKAEEDVSLIAGDYVYHILTFKLELIDNE